METGIEARLWTLKELQEWVKLQMDSCEETQDNWVFIGRFSDEAGNNALFREEPVRIISEIFEQGVEKVKCMGESGRTVIINKNLLENRKMLDTSRYNAFKEMYDKIEELINLTANSPANV